MLYTISGYNFKVGNYKEHEVIIELRAVNEKEALNKVNQFADRNYYEVIKIKEE